MSIAIDLTGRVALVTGAAGVVGSGIARRLALAGASVAIHYRTDRDGARLLAAELGDAAATFEADLVSEEGPDQLLDAVLERFGRLDVLVNNAGIQPVGELADLGDGQWRDMIDTDLTSVHRLTTRAAARMRSGASIVHIASIEGSQPVPGHGHYAAAKAGVIMHARAAAQEWGARGIRVNTVSPGLIRRPGIEADWPEGVGRWERSAPLGRLGTGEDVGDAVVFLASDLAGWVTGIDLVVDGGVSTGPTW